jgi:hypothetical protein
MPHLQGEAGTPLIAPFRARPHLQGVSKAGLALKVH